jgi:type I restriction enzyme S subunit
VLPEFLPFLMMSDRFMNRAVEISVGSLSPTINWATLKLETFDLPPLDQQRRIAEILWAVDEVIARYEDLSGKFDSDIVDKRKRFFETGNNTTKTIGELFEVQLGKMLSQKSRTGEGSFRYLGNKNVQWGRFDFQEMLEMDFSPNERRKFSLRDGDLLVCEGGEVGRSAIWSTEFGECYFQKALHRLRPLNDEISTTYMLEFMYWANEQGLFSSLTGHSTIAHLPVVKLKLVAVPIVSSEKQMEFVRALESAREGLSVACVHIKDTRNLRQSFLNEIFL